MATEKPRFSLTISDDVLQGIERYQLENGISTRNKAIQKLVEKGMAIAAKQSSAKSGSLSDAENQLISKYRALDKRGKEKVDTILKWETERLAEIKRLQDSLKVEASAKIIPMPRRLPIPLSLQPVSAGRGAYLGPEEFETIFVDENDVTKCASFAVRVSGNSMEPSYSDGDILLIQGADDIQVGEIGVFTLDGDGYVKERGNRELISLNPEYAPIPMNDSIWCNGRVIGKLAPGWMA